MLSEWRLKMNMRRFSIFLFNMFILMMLFTCCTGGSNKETDYFYSINSAIKDMDFYIARPEKDKIILYDDKDEPINEVQIAEYDEKKNFIYARKNGTNIFFIINAAVDDEQGILFVNDGSDSILDGIKSIERIGGNSYKYSTMR